MPFDHTSLFPTSHSHCLIQRMGARQDALHNEALMPGIETEGDDRRLNAERTDKQLVELVLMGEEDAFEDLFNRHKRLVAMIASRHFRRYEEIEEIVQISFAKAFTELTGFRGKYDRSFLSWLAAITSNVCRDALRKQKRKPERLDCELNETESRMLLDLSNPNARHAEAMLSDCDLAEKLLSHLPDSERNLLEMLYVHELSVAEIAQREGCSKANVKVRAWRARRAMRKILRKFL